MVSKKLFCFLIVLMSCLLASPAYASRTEVLKSPTVADGKIGSLGTVFMEISDGALKSGDSVIIGLPSGFKFCDSISSMAPQINWSQTVTGTTNQLGNDYNYIKVPQKWRSMDNGLFYDNSLEVTPIRDNEIKLEVQGSPKTDNSCYLYIYLGAIYVEEGYKGNIKLSFSAPSDSGFSFLNNNSSGASDGKTIREEVDNQGSTGGYKTTIPDIQEVKQKAETITKLVPGSSIIEVNGKTFEMDAIPYVDEQSNRMMVPLQFISDILNMGSHLQVDDKQITIISQENKKMLLTIDLKEALVDGIKVQIDCAPLISDNGMIFVPLRFIAETLGAKVNYEQETNQIVLTSSQE
jgi:hypothetical protein